MDQNPAAARKELRAAAKRYGLRVVLDVEETGSGANNDRPGLVRVMDAARRGQVDTVLVWKLDRFGRSSLDLLTNPTDARKFGHTLRVDHAGHRHPTGRRGDESPTADSAERGGGV